MDEDLDGLPEDAISTTVDSSSSDEEDTTKKQEPLPRQRPFNSPKLSFSDNGSDDEDEAMEVDPPAQSESEIQINNKPASESNGKNDLQNGFNGRRLNSFNEDGKEPSPKHDISPYKSSSSSTSPPNSPSPPRKNSDDRKRNRSRSPRRYDSRHRSPVRRRSRSPSPIRRNSNSRRRSPSSSRQRHSSSRKSYSRRSRSPIRRRSRSPVRHRAPQSPDRRRYRSRSRSPKNHHRSSRRSRSRSVEKKHVEKDKFAHFRNRRSRSGSFDNQRHDKKEMEEKHWIKMRSEREKCGAKGVQNVWGRSPTESDLIDIYKEHELAEKIQKEERRKMEADENKRKKARDKDEKKKEKKKLLGIADASESESESSSESESDHKKKKKRKDKKKKHKKEKKEKKSSKKHKKRKRRHSNSSEESESESSDHEKSKKKKKRSKKSKRSNELSEDDWVPVTKEMKKEEEQKAKDEEAQIVGPAIPDHLIKKNDEISAERDFKTDASMKKDMLRGEAEAMSAYIAQGKRIPRRGEIGLSSEEISTFEKVGYVMSGTRHKAMEATRLRKENQLMTADEKRMLSGFTHEQRKQKEDVVLSRMRTLIDSKKSKE